MAIIGPSGTGKATLLRCMNLLERANEGELHIGDVKVNLKNLSKKDILSVRRKSAMVFQNYNLFNNKTVIENVMEALVVVKKMKAEDARKIAIEKLSLVGLADRADDYPSRLSGGHKQRVAIA